ncbi:MAG: EAL domain-containing protein [Spirochaetes bacterium]|nr:EAL domain-containing protein [Spirochaetota bacterium]
MLSNIVKNILPEDFDNLDADWYTALKVKYDRYRFNLLRIILIVTSLIPVFYAVLDIYRGQTAFLVNYAIPFVFLITLFLILVTTRKTNIIAITAMVACVISFILTLYLPNARQISLVIFYCFPPIAFQLRGTRKGVAWIALFMTVAVAMYILQSAGYIPSWQVKYPSRVNVLLAGVALFIISLMTFFGELQHEKSMKTIIRNILFDETTRHLTKKMLPLSIRKNNDYLFAIISIVNFNDLGLIFGYNLSDEILLFCSKQLDLWKDHFKYTIYRLKGNEFGILLVLGKDRREEAIQKMKVIRRLLQSTPMPWKDSELRLNIHIGGVVFHSGMQGESLDILSNADQALKSSIENHRGVTLYENHDHVKTSAFHATTLFSILYKNQEQGTFKAYYQPIVDAATGEIISYESLLRIRNDGGVYESPVQYLPIAESTGLDINLTHFMIKSACEALRHTDKNISVNISFRDMVQSDLINLLNRLYKPPLPGQGRLILEILERSELSEVEACHEFAARASSLGCLIAIDDFGSGYSNFENLLSLPINIIKINGTLIQQMLHNPKARMMIDNIIIFCKQAELLIIAEWVDSPELARELREMGVDFLQGFHFGHPADIPWGDDPSIIN